MRQDRLMGLALHKDILLDIEKIIDMYAKKRKHRLDFML